MVCRSSTLATSMTAAERGYRVGCGARRGGPMPVIIQCGSDALLALCGRAVDARASPHARRQLAGQRGEQTPGSTPST